MLHLFILLGTLWTASGLLTNVPHQDCGSPLAQLTKLEIYPPCEKDVCVLRRGNNVTLLTSFVPLVNTKEMFINVYQKDWYLNLETVVWQNHAVCNKWNVTCPGVVNQTQYSIFTVKLPDTLPTMKLRLKVALVGDGEKQMLCEIVPLDLR